MKKLALMTLALAAALPAVSQAEQGDWVVRARAVHVAPQEKSNLGGDFLGQNGLVSSGAKLEVDSNTIPEVDISYYLTKNIALELILAVGSRHEVSIANSTVGLKNQGLGSVNLLPPTLTAQWHFLPDQKFDPYVGAGVTYSRSLDRSLNTTADVPGVPIRIDRNMWGPALQAGVDFNFKDGWMINLDVKKIWLKTDVKAELGGNWTKIDSLRIDPWLFGIGVGKRF